MTTTRRRALGIFAKFGAVFASGAAAAAVPEPRGTAYVVYIRAEDERLCPDDLDQIAEFRCLRRLGHRVERIR